MKSLINRGHYYFDKIWMYKLMTRTEAYTWLANHMEISVDLCHFRFMNNEQCKEAIRICKQYLNDNRRLDLDFGATPITPYYEFWM